MSQIDHDFDELRRVSRLIHPERYAPSGESLIEYDSKCWHTQIERADGRCGDAWQHRLEAWQKRARVEVEATQAEDLIEGPPEPEEPDDIDGDDQDAPYARVRA